MAKKQTLFASLKNIYKSYGLNRILAGIDLDIYCGEILAIVGDNGTGKSTLIKVLSGDIAPDKGTIKIQDKSYNSLSPKLALELGISTVYQDLALVNCMDVPSNIFLGQELTKLGFWLNKAQMAERSKELLDMVGITINDLNRPVRNFSGGQRQGIAIAKTIQNNGKLLIFDEPTAATGVKETAVIEELLKRMADLGFAVVVISHDFRQVANIAQRVSLVKYGKNKTHKLKSGTTEVELLDLFEADIELIEKSV